MTQVYLVLTDGFEEIEALATVDILRRGEVNVKTVSLTDSRQVTGAHNVPVVADCLFSGADFDSAELLVVPGGTVAFDQHNGLKAQLKQFVDNDKAVAAICAAPMVLGGLGLLAGKKATCYPSFEQYLTDAEVQDGAAVVVDGNITTGRGPGLAVEFALQLLENLKGKAARDSVAEQLLIS
ncbi:MAG: DJ-1 family protein [Gammaproteobacteria bacterium]|nr:MAG: DJ-1 family protein [Gammaproteobacteria bacterium]